jgi:multidrug efflux system membrane fusion protein
MSSRSLLLVFSGSLLAAAGGCEQKQAAAPAAEKPVIPISHPVERAVADFVDFTGRTDAVEAVDVRARVTGYLVRLPYREGSEVRGDDRLRGGSRLTGLLAAPLGQGPLLAAAALFPGTCQPGDLLFEVDPRPYVAQLDQAMAQITLNEASLKLAKTVYDRDQSINAKVPGAISQQQLDQELAAVEEADARVKGSRASTEIYKLNLSYTKVTSPIDGQVSRYYLTVGNVVNQDQTLLTTVVSLDPMYVYFEMDEATLLRIDAAVTTGEITHPQGGTIPVRMGLQNEDGFPHEGTINFVNNQVNAATGSIAVRGVFRNPRLLGGVRMLRPGMFVRVRLYLGEKRPEKLIIDRAIMSKQQGKKFVYVVDADNKVHERDITTGALQEDGLRVVRGVGLNEWVAVGGLLQIQPNLVIRREEVAMPSVVPPPAPEK